mgnify:CR=1 FL=1
MKRTFLVLVGLTLTTTSLAQQSLTIYSGRAKTIVEPVVQQFQQQTGTRLQHIPYKGSGPLATDLLGRAALVVVDDVATGRLYLDGTVLIGAMDGIVRDRIRMALNGHATVSVIIDENDEPLPDAWVETMGLAQQGRAGVPLARHLESELAEFLDRVDARTVMDDKKLDEAIRKITRQVAMEEIGKKPEVTVIISRLMGE